MRSSGALALVCVCTVLACTSNEPEASSNESLAAEPTAELAKPPVGAWVVIDEGSGLFKTANADAERISIIDRGPSEGIRIAEVSAIAGDFIEVRTIVGPSELGCASEVGFEQDYQLRFFVRPEALRLVLARPKQFEFADGTKLELAGGVPVMETGTEGRVRVDRTQLVVNLADEDVGRWFAVPTIEPANESPPELHTNSLELHYGERSFVADHPPFSGAQERVVADGRQLLTFVDACGRFVLSAELDRPGLDSMKAPKDALPKMARNFDPDLVARNAGLRIVKRVDGRFVAPPYGEVFEVEGDDDDMWTCTPPTWTAPVGAELSWFDGGEAGVVRTRHELLGVVDHGDRLCFEVSLFSVCIAAATIERTGETVCKPVDGLVGPGEAKPLPGVGP